MGKGLKILGLAGLLLFGNCPSTLIEEQKKIIKESQIESSFEEQYGKLLAMEISDYYILMKYDRDSDNTIDLRLVYQINGMDKRNFYLKLIKIYDDKNRDGFYEDDEIKIPTEGNKNIIVKDKTEIGFI